MNMWIRYLSVFVPAFSIFAAGEAAGEDLSAKPNIIFILADDLGYGDLECYGQDTIQTPRLDQLADEGMRFTQFYAGSTICAPARCVLMTGFHTGHSTVRMNERPNTPLRREDITVAEMLKRAGYTNIFLGKWGLGGEDDDGNPINVHAIPNNKGFDYAYGYLSQKEAHDYYPNWLWRNGVKETIPENLVGNNINSHDLFTAEALDFVNTASEPFYLQLSYTVPHNRLRTCPIDPIYAGELWPDIEKQFATMITRMDTDIGRIADAVDARGIGTDTLIIFSSDNGPQQEAGEDHLAEFFNSNGLLRGIKRDLYEGGIRVPFIARWTGTVAQGTTSDHIGAFEDFMPTAADIAGIKPPSGIDGISILPTLTGQGTQQQHTHLYWEYLNDQAVRMGNWKAVWINSQFKLFDLATDISEQYDVASQNLQVAQEMAQLMQSSHGDVVYPTGPVLGLAGDVQGWGRVYGMDFGEWTVGGDPVSLTFRVRNDAQSYSNLMEGQVTANQVTDPRISVQQGDYSYLVDGGDSDIFTVTFTPTSGDPIQGQYADITGYKYIYGHRAFYNPIKLYFGQVPSPADFKADGDVDQEDFGFLQNCYSGTGPYSPECADADLDGDGIVDLSDFNLFINCMTGANNSG